MLGPQSSPPARVPRNPDRERRLVYGVGATHLVTFDAGGGRLRSQHYDSEKKASDWSVCQSLALIITEACLTHGGEDFVAWGKFVVIRLSSLIGADTGHLN